MNDAFHDQVPVAEAKMVASKETAENKNSIAVKLLRLTERVDYCQTIKPPKILETVMIADFDKL